jgi:hypothetical protein
MNMITGMTVVGKGITLATVVRLSIDHQWKLDYRIEKPTVVLGLKWFRKVHELRKAINDLFPGSKVHYHSTRRRLAA